MTFENFSSKLKECKINQESMIKYNEIKIDDKVSIENIKSCESWGDCKYSNSNLCPLIEKTSSIKVIGG